LWGMMVGCVDTIVMEARFGGVWMFFELKLRTTPLGPSKDLTAKL
jgi:hypothetical protein